MKTEQAGQHGGKAALHSRARHSSLHGVVCVQGYLRTSMVFLSGAVKTDPP